MNLEYAIKPRTIALILGILALFLALQSIFGEYINTNILHGQYNSLPSLILDEFSVNAEQTIPTWYQVILLLGASVLLAAVAGAKHARKDPYRRYWVALALIFLYLSMDESAAIHELFSEPLHAAFHTSGILAFGWQIAAAPLLLIFGLFFLRFLFHLPSRTRNLFIVAGALYIGGAFVTDALSANLLPPNGELTLRYLVVGTLEEALEMAGQVTFIYALLSYIAEMGYGFTFRSQYVIPQQTSPEATRVPESLQQSADITANPSKKKPQLVSLFRWMILGSVLIIGVNVALVYWAVTQQAVAIPTVTNPVPVYEAIIEGFPQNEMTVTRVLGLFDSDNPAMNKFVTSLVSLYHDVIVVTVPSAQSSIVIAGDKLPFDRQALSDFLLGRGEIEFNIFDTLAIKRLIDR